VLSKPLVDDAQVHVREIARWAGVAEGALARLGGNEGLEVERRGVALSEALDEEGREIDIHARAYPTDARASVLSQEEVQWAEVKHQHLCRASLRTILMQSLQ
jgi:hypothetical protein